MYILIVDDDPMSLELAKFVLRNARYEVEAIDNTRGALHLIESRVPDLLILDVKMPGIDGFAFSERLTHDGYSIPLIYVTSCSSLDERIRGFDLGAQDFICKPYYPQELLARVNVAARLQKAQPPTQHVRAGSMELIPETLQVILNGTDVIALTPIEMQILLLLMSHVEQVVKRELILTHVWKEQTPSSNNLDVVIGHLRHKLGIQGKQIVSVRGIGYRLLVKGCVG